MRSNLFCRAATNCFQSCAVGGVEQDGPVEGQIGIEISVAGGATQAFTLESRPSHHRNRSGADLVLRRTLVREVNLADGMGEVLDGPSRLQRVRPEPALDRVAFGGGIDKSLPI